MAGMEKGGVDRANAAMAGGGQADMAVVVHVLRGDPHRAGRIALQCEVGPERAAQETGSADDNLVLLREVVAGRDADPFETVIAVEHMI